MNRPAAILSRPREQRFRSRVRGWRRSAQGLGDITMRGSVVAAGLALGIALGFGPAGVAPAAAREVVHFAGDARPGTVVVRTGERRL